MAIYVSGKTKRKDLDEVDGVFSDFMLSAPATKIRRLDPELALLSNNQESFTTSVLGIDLRDEEMSVPVMDASSGLTQPASPSTLNAERALVMYRPSDPHMASSFKINPKLITGLKNYTFWPRNPNMAVEEESWEETESSGAKKCLAMVPWFPSHATVTRQVMEALASEKEINAIEEPMEAEGTADHTFMMEIEEENGGSDNTAVGAQDNQPWQQHCMTPQHFLQSNSSMMWS